jgi:hypothetical protein
VGCVPKPKPNTCLVLVQIPNTAPNSDNQTQNQNILHLVFFGSVPKYFGFGIFWKRTKQSTLFGTLHKKYETQK